MKHLGDMAEAVAQKLSVDSSAPVAQAAALTEEAALAADNSLFTKIRFSWKAEDRAVLERIRASADAMFEEAFATSIAVVDEFFSSLWTAEIDSHTGVVRRDATGRPVWRRDSEGHPIEDWAQLTGQDIEKALMGLARIKLHIAPMINELFLEALYARNLASDASDDAWVSVLEGTQGDRQAKANRDSRVDRYHAYFRYVVWSTGKTFLDEVTAFQRRLEKILDYRVWSQR